MASRKESIDTFITDVLETYQELGKPYLKTLALTHPRIFISLLLKLIPESSEIYLNSKHVEQKYLAIMVGQGQLKEPDLHTTKLIREDGALNACRAVIDS